MIITNKCIFMMIIHYAIAPTVLNRTKPEIQILLVRIKRQIATF